MGIIVPTSKGDWGQGVVIKGEMPQKQVVTESLAQPKNSIGIGNYYYRYSSDPGTL